MFINFLRLFVNSLNVGDWAMGENGIYNLEYQNLTFKKCAKQNIPSTK